MPLETYEACASLVRELLGDTDVPGGDVFQDSEILGSFGSAWDELMTMLSSDQVPAAERIWFHTLAMDTGVLFPSQAQITDLDSVSLIEERSVGLSVAIANVTSRNGTIQITTVAPHGLTGTSEVFVSDVPGVPAANGRWLATAIDFTDLLLRGSIFSGSYVPTSTPSISQVDLAGTQDGSNLVFTLPVTPTNGATPTVNGIIQDIPGSCSVSGSTVTFAAGHAPGSADVLQALVNVAPVALIGTVDGTNPTFFIPSAVTTDALIGRAGILQDPGSFTRVGQTVTFMPGNIPQPGDSVIALVDVTTTTLTATGTASIYTLPTGVVAAIFRNGVLQKKTLSYSLSPSGLVVTFTAGNIPGLSDTIQAVNITSAGSGAVSTSTDQFTEIWRTMTLPDLAPDVKLRVYEWREEAFWFVGATGDVQLRITYRTNNTAPGPGGSLVYDGIKNALAHRTAAILAYKHGRGQDDGKRLDIDARGEALDGCGGFYYTFLSKKVREMHKDPVARPIRTPDHLTTVYEPTW